MKVLHRNILNNITVLMNAGYLLGTAKLIAARLGGKVILNVVDNNDHFKIEVLDMGVRNIVRVKKVIDFDIVMAA